MRQSERRTSENSALKLEFGKHVGVLFRIYNPSETFGLFSAHRFVPPRSHPDELNAWEIDCFSPLVGDSS